MADWGSVTGAFIGIDVSDNSLCLMLKEVGIPILTSTSSGGGGECGGDE